MELGYGNMRIFQLKNGKFVLRFSDASYMSEIADVLEKVPRKMCGEHSTRTGSLVYGTVFIFSTEEEAVNSAKKIVESVYKKH